MYPTGIRCRAFRYPVRRRVCTFVLILSLYCLLHYLPDLPATQGNTWADQRPPKHHVDEKPHFLYRSPLRQNPDLEYEKQLSNALQKFEQEVLARNGGSERAEDRIWQIAQDEDYRGSDSLAFEQRNHDWTYTVCLLATLKIPLVQALNRRS